MALTGKFIADFASFYTAVETADIKLKTLGDGANLVGPKLNKMVEGFSGKKVIQDATLMVEAIERVGGVSKLTDSELTRAGASAEEAAKKMRALGMDVPKSLTDVADAAKKIPKPLEDTDKAGKDAALSMSALTSSALKLAAGWLTVEAALALVKGAWSATLGLVTDSIASASEAEDAQAGLTAALRAQGTAVPSVVGAYDDYAVALERTTRYSDDMAQAAMGVLVTVGNVMPRDMEKAMQATANLAATFKKDLPDAALIVAKAAAGTTTALNKLGIETKTTEGKQKDFVGILDAVNTGLAGQAAAAANTYAGRIAMLGNAWDNVKESIGRAFITNETLLTAIGLVTEGIIGQTGELSENQRVMNFISDAIIGTVRASALLLEGISLLTRQFANMLVETTLVTRGFKFLVDGMVVVTQAAAAIGNTAAQVALPKLQQLQAGMATFADMSLRGAGTLLNVSTAAHDLAGKATTLAGQLELTRGKTVDVVRAGVEVAGVWDQGTANLKDHTAALEAARKAQEAYEQSLRTIVDDLSGGGVIDKAHLWLQALRDTVPVTQMTREAQDKVNRTMVDAIAAYTALGEIAPQALRDVWLATLKPLEVSQDLVASLKSSATQLTLWSTDAIGAITALPKGIASMKIAPGLFDGLGKGIATTLSGSILRAIEGGGDIAKSIGGSLANLMTSATSGIGKKVGEGLSKTLGTTIGGALGSIVPGLGTILGGLAGSAVGKLFGKMFGGGEEKEVNKLRDQFIAAAGGLHELNVKATAAGTNLDALLKADKVKEYEAAVKGLGTAFTEADTAAAAEQERITAGIATLTSGFNTMAVAVQGDALAVTALGSTAVATFAAMQAEGASWSEALKAIQPGLESLRTSYEDLGIEVEDVALNALLMQSAILDKNPALIEGISAVAGQFDALNDLGLLNVDTFTDMETVGMTMYQRLQGEVAALGGTTKDALLPMQGYLHEAEEAAAKLGIPLDDNTQMLIDQSKEMGIWKEKGETANDKLLKGIDLLVAEVELVGQIGGELPKAIGKVPREIPINVVYHDPGFTPRGATVAAEGFQEGTGGYRNFGAGTPVILHGWEAVVPMEKKSTAGPPLLEIGGGGGTGTPVIVNITINAEGAFFDTPGSLQRLADRVNEALTAKFGMTHRLRAA